VISDYPQMDTTVNRSARLTGIVPFNSLVLLSKIRYNLD